MIKPKKQNSKNYKNLPVVKRRVSMSYNAKRHAMKASIDSMEKLKMLKTLQNPAILYKDMKSANIVLIM